MKVVAVVEKSWLGLTPAGGAETMIHDLLKHLASAGWEAVGLVLNGLPHHGTLDGVTVIRSQDKDERQRIVKSADVLITHLGATNVARGYSRAFNLPLAQLIHNTSYYSVGFLGEGCDLAIYNAEWVKQYHDVSAQSKLIQHWDSSKSISFKHRKCFDWPSVTVRPPTQGDPYLVTPGKMLTLVNLVPNKGPDVFYALAEANPDLQFMGVIGGYEPERQVIQNLPNVTIHPHTADTAEFYSETAILLVPSNYESYGRVAVEAMRWGIPVITSGTPGLRECVGDAGLHVDREDLDGWSKAIRQVLENYEGFSADANHRYSELEAQTETDLNNFAEAMKELVKRGPSNNSSA